MSKLCLICAFAIKFMTDSPQNNSENLPNGFNAFYFFRIFSCRQYFP